MNFGSLRPESSGKHQETSHEQQIVENGNSSSNLSVSDRIQQMRSKMKELTDKRNNHQSIPEGTLNT